MSWDRPFGELALGEGALSPGRTVTEADIAAFAALTGDMHPLHTDAVWAARSPFGQRIAHGMLLVSYAVGLAPFEPERVLALRAVRDAVFKRPVAIGDTICAQTEIVSLRALGDGAGLVGVALRIVNQHGQLCVCAELELLWRRSAVAEAA